MRNKDYDYIGITYASTDDTYVFYRGGTSGVLVQTTTLVYSDTAKGTLMKVINT